jgi:hypothetical protein
VGVKRDIVIARNEAIQAQAMPRPPPGLHRLCYVACAWIASGCALAMTATFEAVMYSANVSVIFRRILRDNSAPRPKGLRHKKNPHNLRTGMLFFFIPGGHAVSAG